VRFVIPLITITKLRAREGQREAALEVLQEAQRATRQEAGCRLYALHHDASDPQVFVMITGWDSEEARHAHVASPHAQAVIARSSELFEGRVEIQQLTALPNGDAEKGEL
jgi:quinol monooxygenase YgiN